MLLMLTQLFLLLREERTKDGWKESIKKGEGDAGGKDLTVQRRKSFEQDDVTQT